jgi:hypothetical protein
MTAPSEHELEETIRLLPFVYEVRVQLADGDVGGNMNWSVEKVHVLIAPGRSPKKVVRDIETMLMLKFNMRIDYRKISLVQGRPEDVRPFMRPRLRFAAADLRSTTAGHRVQVSLTGESRTYLGVAEGAPDADACMLAVQATVDALQALFTDTTITLEALETVRLGDRHAMLALMKVIVNGTSEQLLGSCFQQGEPLSAAVRATLDALNRRFFGA